MGGLDDYARLYQLFCTALYCIVLYIDAIKTDFFDRKRRCSRYLVNSTLFHLTPTARGPPMSCTPTHPKSVATVNFASIETFLTSSPTEHYGRVCRDSIHLSSSRNHRLCPADLTVTHPLVLAASAARQTLPTPLSLGPPPALGRNFSPPPPPDYSRISLPWTLSPPESSPPGATRPSAQLGEHATPLSEARVRRQAIPGISTSGVSQRVRVPVSFAASLAGRAS